MIECIAPDIYRIGVQLPGSPLKELNSYLLRGLGRDLLIDTGFRQPECRDSLLAALKELNANPDKLDIVNTHLHADHTGLDLDVVGESSCIYIHEKDLTYLRTAVSGFNIQKSNERFLDEGYPSEVLALSDKINPATRRLVERVDNHFRGITQSDRISIGQYVLQPIFVPGHTPGHIMLWEENTRIMFTGDHVLFDISPNIAYWHGVEDSLGDYLQSLRKAADYPVRLALPGHRGRGDYQGRINELLQHHEKRLREVLSIVERTPGASAYEIAGQMSWRIRCDDWNSFPPAQKWFAMGECLSHLDLLCLHGKIKRTKGKVWEYRGSGSYDADK